MYAIVAVGGKQYRVEQGAVLDIGLIDGAKEKALALDQVLLVADGDTVRIGQPYVKGATVQCAVVGHRQGPKVITYKYRRRKNSHWKRGHRQQLLRIRVEKIDV